MAGNRVISVVLLIVACGGGAAVLMRDGNGDAPSADPDDPCVIPDEEMRRSPYFSYSSAVEHVKQETVEGQCSFGVEIGQCDDQPWNYISYNTGYVGGRYYYSKETGELMVMASWTDAMDEQCQGQHHWPRRTEGSICVHDGNRVDYHCYDAAMLAPGEAPAERMEPEPTEADPVEPRPTKAPAPP